MGASFFGLFLLTAIASAAPNPPQNPRFQSGIYNHAALFVWDSSTGAVNYNVYRTSAPAGFPNEIVLDTNTIFTNYLSSGLPNGVTFYFRVTAIDNGNNESAPSISTGLWTHPAAPTAPSNFAASSITATSVLWTWAPGTAPEGAHRVVHGVTNEPVSADLSLDTTQYLETGYGGGDAVPPRKVIAYNITGAASSGLLTTYTALRPPSDLQFEFVGASISFNWQTNGNGSSVTYYVQNSDDGISFGTILKPSGEFFSTTSTVYLDTTLSEGATRYFRIYANNPANQNTFSDYSNVIGAVTIRYPPAAVTDLAAYTGDREGQVRLRWTATGDNDRIGDLISPAAFRIDWSTNSSESFYPGPNNATPFSTSAAAGSMQDYVVIKEKVLKPGTTYTFAVFIQDNDGNWSKVSNTATVWAQWDVTPPDRITDLKVSMSTDDVLATLSWTGPGDDGLSKNLDGSYLIGYSSQTILNLPDFYSRAVSSSIAPGEREPGESLTALFRNLTSPGTLYFALQALDERGNASLLSNAATAHFDNVAPLDVSAFSVTADTASDNLNHILWATPQSVDLSSAVILRKAGSAPDRSLIYRKRGLVIDGETEDKSKVLVVTTATAVGQYDYWDLIAGTASLNTTFYYLMMMRDRDGNYSSGTAVSVLLRDNVAPRAPAYAASQVEGAGLIKLTWDAPLYDVKRSSIGVNPAPYQINTYEIYKAPDPNGPWTRAASIPSNSTSASLSFESLEYYRIQAVDAFGNSSDFSLVVDNQGRTFVAAAEDRAKLSLTNESMQYMKEIITPWGVGVEPTMRCFPELKNRVILATCEVYAVQPGTGAIVPNFVNPRFIGVNLPYSVNAAGLIGALGASPMVSTAPVRAEDAERNLGIYWDNGAGKVKIYGKVNIASQTISADVSNAGTYYVQRLYRESSFDFDTTRVNPRVITPNSDGLNDVVIFRYDNPKDLDVAGKIFDVFGGKVADLPAGPVMDSKLWDGKDSSGQTVGGGVYLYLLEAEGRTFSGTIVVAR